MFLSKCCNAPISFIFSPDFLGDNPKKMKVGTIYFGCEKCRQPCDAEIDPKLYKGKKKRNEQRGKNRKDKK